MTILRRLPLAVALSAALIASGCTTLASAVSTVAQNVSSSTPTQVTTFADATAAADLVTRAVDVYVNTGNPSRATLLEIQALSNSVHAAFLDLQAANDKGQSLVFASFNASLSAFNAYATSQGIAH